MTNSTTDIYEIKRKIMTFSNKLTRDAGKIQAKFVGDMIYGLARSRSVLLSDISDALMEPIKKINTIERLSKNLMTELDYSIKVNYDHEVKRLLGESPVILVDDSDIIKPYGFHFDSLGMVRDGSSPKKVYEKGYMVTEMVAVTQRNKQPISLFSHIHSSTEKTYKSTTLCDARKGKIKTTVLFAGEQKECFISHLNVQITASKNNICLVLVYGLGKKPMILATNKPILGKEDVVNILRLYMSRWRIEEYFRFKKQAYDFENFRVRNLRAINNLNKLLTYTLGFIAMLSDHVGKNNLANKMVRRSKALRSRVLFHSYQISKGIANTLAYAKSGIKAWQNIRHIEIDQHLQLRLIC